MDVDVAQRERSSIKRYASAFSNILIKFCFNLYVLMNPLDEISKAPTMLNVKFLRSLTIILLGGIALMHQPLSILLFIA